MNTPFALLVPGNMCDSRMWLGGGGAIRSVLCPPSWHTRWSSLTSDFSVAEIAGAGHMAPLERPEVFASAIEDWITSNQERLYA